MEQAINPALARQGVTAPTNESSVSAVSWAAILAGAIVAAATSVLLVALGAGLGLASISPWPNAGASMTSFTVATAIGLIVVQWISSGMGGYITGRLRTKWVGTHTHEVFFRDTAHGFVTWSLATIIGAGLLASAASSSLGTGVRALSTAASGAAQGAAATSQAGGSSSPYDVDMLFRPATPDANTSTADARAETAHILTKAFAAGDVPDADRTYLVQLVAARAGISQEDAQKRVDYAVAQLKAAELKAREAANAARKAASAASIFTALSMLIGAFIACAAAALGGRLRDEHI